MKKIVLLFMTVLGCVTFVMAQNMKVSGTVTAEDGMPVIGATVVVKDNPTIGITTDVNGEFVLRNVPAGANQKLQMWDIKRKKLLLLPR